jgi:quinol-cytochrome oxidoreductase complex cytochrome b subunit
MIRETRFYVSASLSGVHLRKVLFMVNLRQPRDVAQILLSVLFLAIMIIACLWIVQPFVLGFAWAATVVVATWPLLCVCRNCCLDGVVWRCWS